MSHSDSDDSWLADYLPGGKAKTEGNDGISNGKKPSPKITYTGSSEQPMTLDDSDDSDDDDEESSAASSMLEVLPPKKRNTTTTTDDVKVIGTPAAATKKPLLAANDRKVSSLGDDSDSDDSLLQSPGVKALPSKKSSNKSSSLAVGSSPTCKKYPPKSNHDVGIAKKKSTAQEKQMERERQKQEKLAQKQADQARRKAEREAAKEQKQQEKQEAAESRKRQRLEQQAARGNFATSEIVLLVDPPLFRRRTEKDCYNWQEHDEMTNHKFSVQEYRSALGGSTCQALQWIRRDYLQGGAAEAWEQLRQNNPQGYAHLDRLVVVIDDPKVFIRLLQRTPQDDVDDDYPQLREWLVRLDHGWKAAWPNSEARPKIMLILHRAMEELDRQWVDFRKTHKNSARINTGLSPPSAEEFHDALTWMLIQFQVESMCCESYEEIWTAALKMTRALAKAPYQHPITEGECRKRLKTDVSDSDPPLVIAQDAWFRQLQCIPNLSETKARFLIQHYPTIQSLWQAYQEASNPGELVAGCLSDRSYQVKLSESIHKVLTSTNPEELI